jgi:phosphatidylserine/phosphatidylglycerophosphate/cardiolipin synthase-like enzyme
VPRQHRSRGGRNRSTGLTPSRSRAAGLFLASLLLLSFGVGSAHAGTAPSADAADSALSESNTTATAAILAVYPDPTRDHDAGEYVLLRLPDAGNWSVSDGEATTRLRNVSGRVLVTPEPRALGETVGNETTVVEGSFALANGGEAVSLRRGNETVHRVRYGESSEGERYLPAADEWRPRGLDPRSAVPTGPANATAFLLPDSPKVPIETLREAEDRILLAGYTFTSERVADVLLATRARGVDVRVLVEADPVGGASAQQARVLDRLAAAGVEVRVVGVGANRFAYHHPKYAVADGRALVLSENWKPSGVGGASSRGWGVRVENSSTAAELAALFRNDSGAPDTRTWQSFRENRQFEWAPPANGSYPTGFPAEHVTATNVTLLTSPGNAESELVAAIDAAEERIDVLQPTLGRQDNALVRATLRAAQRGVEVRILLSGAWYSAEENDALVTWLNDWAERNDAPLTARIAEPGGRYEKVHAKGLLIDDDLAVVGSLNWNENSATENREVALALHGPEPVAFYRESFDADWRGGSGGERLWLYATGAVAAVLVAVLVATRSLNFAAIEKWNE